VPYVDILLDNRVSCSFIETNELENVIFCRPLEESLNNVSLIQTKDAEFIHNYLEESAGNYLVSDITLDNGTVYNDVRFKMVTIEEGRELPVSTINLSTLGIPSVTDSIPSVQLLEEDYNHIPESVEEEEDDFSVLYETTKIDNTSEIIQKVKRLENKLIEEQEKIDQEKIRLDEERITLDADRRLQKTLEDYKSELLQESFLVSEHQKEILEKAINGLGSSLQEQFDSQQINVGKYLDEISIANLDELKKYQDSQVSKIKDGITALLSEHKELSLEEINDQLLVHTDELEKLLAQKLTLELESHKRELSQEVEAITTAVDKLVEEKLKIEAQNIDKLLVDRSGNLQSKFSEDIDIKLDENKKSLFKEFESVSTTTASALFSTKTEELKNALDSIINEHRQGLNDTVNKKLNEVTSTVSKFTADIDGKLPQLEDTIKDINKRIQNLVIEKKNVQLVVDDARKYTDTKVAQVSEEVMNYARRILDLGGGGGSNAVQYANGGTMNGDLNVTGQYLSGGISLFNILSGSGGGGSIDRLNNGTVQVILSSDNLLHFPTGTIGDTVLDGGFTILGNPGSYAELASNDGNVFAWASDTNYGNPVGGGFSIGTDTTTLTGGYVWTFGNDGLLRFPDGTIQPTAFTNNLDSYASLNYVNSNFLNLTGGLISGPVRINNNLTVFGNLTATGTTTFANTVFSVTSALSVIHVGSGPAMYVGNSGDGDIASFYDLDQNIEVFHVGGNNGSHPNVGVKTSTPNVDFTVNGQISANNTIWSANGNSNNWNGAFDISTAYQNTSSSFITTPIGDSRYSKLSSQIYIPGSGTNSIQTVSGNNISSGCFSNVAGGCNNTASSNYSNVVGGYGNTASGFYDSENLQYTGQFSTVGGGRSNITCGTFNVVAGGESNIVSGYTSSVGGGWCNNVSGSYSSIAGGNSNCILGDTSFIGGGYANIASGSYSSIAGGRNNTASGYYSSIANGYCNVASGCFSNITGGCFNRALSAYSNIGGGSCNLASGNYSTVVGGFSSCATGFSTFVGAGSGNRATGDYGIVVGGQRNTASGIYSIVGGGITNRATGACSSVLGGISNCASAPWGAVLGGSGNIASGAGYAVVAGGAGNNTNGCGGFSAVLGGGANNAGGQYAAIVGGSSNNATVQFTFVGGGERNSSTGCLSNVVGGRCNTSSGVYSSIVGGLGNFNPLRDSIIGGGVANHTGGFAPFNITNAAAISGNGTQTRFTGSGIQSLFSFPFTSNNVSLYYATPTVPLSAGTFTTATIAATGTNFIVVNGDYSTCTPTGLSATSVYVYDRSINQTGYDNVINGGKLNTASGCYGFIGGGLCNTITRGNNSTINGGSRNNVNVGAGVADATIAGGSLNTVLNKCGTISGGAQNCVNADQGTISGGYQHIIFGNATAGTIAGGTRNCISGSHSVITGGGWNTTSTAGAFAFIGGGVCNSVLNGCSSTVGGRCNTTSSAYSTIVGGKFNYNPLFNSNIVGGSFNHTGGFTPANITFGDNLSGNGTNTALIATGIGSCFSASGTTGAVSLMYMTSGTANSTLSSALFTTANIITNAANCIVINGDYSACRTGLSACSVFVFDRCLNIGGRNNFIGGGILNTASGTYSVVGGGSNNIAAGTRTSVAGGFCNIASGEYSFVAGGSANDTKGFANTFILGSSLSATKANYTYVNNLSVQGNIESNTNYVVTVALTANQTANNASDTTVALDPLNDPNNWFDRSTRRLTPTIPGYYHVDYQVAWVGGTAGSGNQNNIQIRKNATSMALAQQPISDSNVNTTQNTADIAYLNGTTDYLEFVAYSSNAAQNIIGTADGAWTKVEVFKIN